MQPAGAVVGTGRQFGLRDFQRLGPALFVGAKCPARVQHGRMLLPGGGNQIQLGPRLLAATQSQPADGGVQVVVVGWFKTLHADRKTVARLVGKQRREAMSAQFPNAARDSRAGTFNPLAILTKVVIITAMKRILLSAL